MIRFTIATVCFNAADNIQHTLNSIAQQTYPHVQHLIVDGASSDDTCTLVNHYAQAQQTHQSPHDIVLHSAPDKGIYDAMNKALNLATGDYILFINAGDGLHETTTLEQIASQLTTYPQDTLPAVLYGDTQIIDSTGKYLYLRQHRPPKVLTSWSFNYGMLVCHQAFAVHRDFYSTVHYDLHYRFSADFDWCIRIMRKAESTARHFHNTQLILADYLNEGTTTRHHKASLQERYRIMSRYYGNVRTFLRHLYFAWRAFMK